MVTLLRVGNTPLTQDEAADVDGTDAVRVSRLILVQLIRPEVGELGAAE